MRKNAANNDNESKFVDEWAAGCCIGRQAANVERKVTVKWRHNF